MATVHKIVTVERRWRISKWRFTDTKVVALDTDQEHDGNQEVRPGRAHGAQGAVGRQVEEEASFEEQGVGKWEYKITNMGNG